jgi:Antitoxin Phd_YefM, type II toxin-antitoxin system
MSSHPLPWKVFMRAKTKRKRPEIILREGEPRAVILDIDDYREMLERLEDLDDLRMLEQMRKRPLSFRTLEEFLEENSPRV